MNADLPHYKQIRAFHVVPEPFSIDNGLLTANGKLKRDAICARFAAEIENLYQIRSSRHENFPGQSAFVALAASGVIELVPRPRALQRNRLGDASRAGAVSSPRLNRCSGTRTP